MSGPKSSRFKINQEMEEKIREEIRLKQEKEKLIIKINEKINYLKDRINLYSKEIEEINKEGYFDTFLINEKLKEVTNKINEFKKNNFDDYNKLKNYLSLVENFSNQINSEMDEYIENNLKRLRENKEIIEKIGINKTGISNKSKVQLIEKKNNYLDDMYKAFSNVLDELIESQFNTKRNELIGIRNRIKEIITNKNENDEDKFKELDILEKTFNSLKHEYVYLIKQNKKEFEEIYYSYLSLCSIMKIEPQRFEFHQFEYLKKEYDNLKNIYYETIKNNYISDSLKEVMYTLGIEVVESQVLEKTNDTIIKNIFDFKENSVISSYIRKDGSFLIEVNAVGDEGKVLDSYEKKEIVSDMQEFCTVYELIKKELNKKGIIFDNEVLRNPDEKYIRVINIPKSKKYKQNKKIKRMTF